MAGEELDVQHAALQLAGLDGSASREHQRAALTTLFENEFRRVYSYVFARTGSSSVAEEVAADTFAEAARVVNEGRGAVIDITWLRMVAKRRLIDHWRRSERHRRRIERLRIQRSRADLGDQPRGLQDDRMLSALTSLPVRQRAVLTLRYIDEYSVSEIATTLDLSYKAAESLLSRARSGFAKAMEAEHD